MKLSFSRTGKSSRAGFTMLEVLLAVALGAFILTAMTSFLFSMAELWGVGANERLFEKHARGVSRFLENGFQTASARYDTAGNGDGPVFWMKWEGDNSESESFLSFELDQGPGALVWPDEPLPHVVCSLKFDPREGLFLLWRSRLEESFDDEAPRRTLISPFVKEIEYHYIDYTEENPKWKIEKTPLIEAGNEYVMPERIVLKFRFEKEEVVRQLILPKNMEGTPIL